jgi:hypothetical protein
MRTILIRCYPAGWRARYGDEFLALLEERPLGPYDVADILLGALDAQLRLRGRHAPGSDRRGISMSLRLGGLAAIIGAVLWAVAGLLSLGVIGPVEGGVPVALLMTGMLVLLVAVAGLSAFQARTHPEATWAAFIVTALGTFIFFAGYIGSVILAQDGFWGLWFIGLLTVILGSGLFAAVTYRTRVLSRLGAALIGIGIAIILSEAILEIPTLITAGMACFALGWFTLGVQAIRLDRPAAATASPA